MFHPTQRIFWKYLALIAFYYKINEKYSSINAKIISLNEIRHWPNISANDPDPDPGSGSKKLILNRDHFLVDDPVKYFCFLGSFERKFLKQSTAYYRVWGFVIEFW